MTSKKKELYGALDLAVRAEWAWRRVNVYFGGENNEYIVVAENDMLRDGTAVAADILKQNFEGWLRCEIPAENAGLKIYDVDDDGEEKLRKSGSFDGTGSALFRIPEAFASEDLKRACVEGPPFKRPAAEAEAPRAKRPAVEGAASEDAEAEGKPPPAKRPANDATTA